MALLLQNMGGEKVEGLACKSCSDPGDKTAVLGEKPPGRAGTGWGAGGSSCRGEALGWRGEPQCQGIRGGSVLFHVTTKQEAEPEEVSWAFGPESNYSVLLRVHRGADTPTWVSLQDKYQQRVHVPNILSLKIENLTCEDSGQYWARVSFPGGVEYTQVFLLTVYGICSTVAHSSGPHGSEAQDSAFVPMYGIQGGSVLFHVIKKQEADPEEVLWSFGPLSNYRVLLQVHHWADNLTWVILQDKYQQRVHVPNVTSLKIENLTQEDSGQYRARARFTGGRELTQVFHLTVYEPVILPEILVKSSSITPSWCNVTLECKTPGNREDLNVTWESEGLPRELVWSETPELAPNTWQLTMNLPLSQPNASLTCVVSNYVDKKTVSVDFEQVCSHAPPSIRVTRYRSLRSTANLLLLLNFSHNHALLSTSCHCWSRQ
ncbi:hypothetical protein E5288_WYG015207 [Bos mutus]|uniref:Ig-like domain-containing protein n=1 Tax=Bos mutus TaxID=72004 RepID=A0A6B0S0U0_9CETA|nr:hypothetical protein [Bos mutus]